MVIPATDGIVSIALFIVSETFMSVFRACAAAAVVLAFAVQPGIAASFPADSSQPSSARGRLLHLVHGEHEECVLAHRHRWDGRVVPCLLEDTDDDEDD